MQLNHPDITTEAFDRNYPLRDKLKYAIVFTPALIHEFYLAKIQGKAKHAPKPCEPIDALNNIPVFYNGRVRHVNCRNVTTSGYNIGLTYQCVEFVKRYYYLHYQHQMPETGAHAYAFINRQLNDGEINKDRALWQFNNPSQYAPQVGNIVVYKRSLLNPFGHVAIVAEVDKANGKVEVIQQNAGPYAPSRECYNLVCDSATQRWKIQHKHIVGWLGIEER